MNIPEFLNTIYLGDRACKAILIDAWNLEVKVTPTCISRIRSSAWDFYTAEDIQDGSLVFEGVKRIEFCPSGFMPNDLHDISAIPAPEGKGFKVATSVDSVDDGGDRTEVKVIVWAASLCLEDNANPGQRIRQ